VVTGWRPGANDNTVGGWVVTGVYAIAVFLCWRAFFVVHSSKTRPSVSKLPGLFWLALALGITALGINKQMDFQTALIEVGRALTLSAGVSQYRRKIEAAFVVVAGLVAIYLWAIFWKLGRRSTRPDRLVLLGTVATIGFVFLRTADILHVIEKRNLLNQHRPLIVLELAVLSFFCVVVWRSSRSL
jgi:hypothetical protein